MEQFIVLITCSIFCFLPHSKWVRRIWQIIPHTIMHWQGSETINFHWNWIRINENRRMEYVKKATATARSSSRKFISTCSYEIKKNEEKSRNKMSHWRKNNTGREKTPSKWLEAQNQQSKTSERVQSTQ